ncbi:MAG: hypothetical protein ACFHWZ_08625 [Phycisphaerales bacterium]
MLNTAGCIGCAVATIIAPDPESEAQARDVVTSRRRARYALVEHLGGIVALRRRLEGNLEALGQRFERGLLVHRHRREHHVPRVLIGAGQRTEPRELLALERHRREHAPAGPSTPKRRASSGRVQRVVFRWGWPCLD